jgi:hypothetical protein
MLHPGMGRLTVGNVGKAQFGGRHWDAYGGIGSLGGGGKKIRLGEPIYFVAAPPAVGVQRPADSTEQP